MSLGRSLYLVDGTYLLFRAYHSLPTTMAVTGAAYRKNRVDLEEVLREGAGTPREPDGVAQAALEWLRDPAHDRLPTNAVRGLTSVLLKLIREEKPDHLGVAFDLPGPVHRDEHYQRFAAEHPDYAPGLEGYKATRPETPPEIHAQFPLARVVCGRGLGIPLLEAEGFEADDMIGTLARRARDGGFDVFLVTADKDLFQLVEEGISILNPHKPDPKRLSGYLLMDAAVVEREFGVPPSKVVDVLALMGDSSDNIPGVPGIGEKGAKDLVRTFGSVEGCLRAAQEEGKIARKAYRKGLLEHAALALFSKELATIRVDAPLAVGPEEIARRAPDPESLKRVFNLLSFGMLLRDAEGLIGGGGVEVREGETPAAAVQTGGAEESRPPRRESPRAPLSGSPLFVGTEDGLGDERRSPEQGSPEEGDAPGVEPSDTDAERYRAVLDPKELAALLPAMLAAPRVAVDTETTSENPMRTDLVGISIAWEANRAIYVPIGHRYLGAPAQPARENVLRILAPLLEDSKKIKTGQNVKYDVEVLIRAGSKPAGFLFDTMIAAFLLEPDRPSFGLSTLAKEYLGDYKTPFSEVAGKGAKQITFDQVEIARAAAYSGRDADVTLRLAELLGPRLDSEGLASIFDTIDMPLVEVLVAMERTGVRIDTELLARLSREMGGAIAALREEIHRLAGREFNVDSPQQLAKVLFDEIGLAPVSRTAKSGAASTRDEDLEVLAQRHPLPGKVRDYRGLAKLRSTYVDALPQMIDPETGRVHTSFNPTGAATGRLSSSDPNLQNIPVRTAEGRKIRAAFIPERGWTLVSADYSQVELRVLAHLSGDEHLIEAFVRGEDIHRSTAAKIFEIPYEDVDADQRRAAKTINFGILYGMGSQRLARELAIPMARAKELIDSYFGRFPKIRAYVDGTIARAEKDGHVATLFGRLRRFPEILSTSRNQRQMAIRAAVNSTIQGTAADLMKLAMIRLHRALAAEGFSARILIQVHDELVLEAPPRELRELEKTIRSAMEKVHPLKVPLTVDIESGPNWLEAKH